MSRAIEAVPRPIDLTGPSRTLDSALPSTLSHLLRVLQLLLLCTVLTFASAPARASVMIDPVAALDEGAHSQRDNLPEVVRPLSTALEALPQVGKPAAPALPAPQPLPPGSPLFILQRRLLR